MKRIPKSEIFRAYKVERDPDPNFRVLPCDFAELRESEDGWV